MAEFDKKTRDKRPTEEINSDDEIESSSSKERNRVSLGIDADLDVFNDEGTCDIPFSSYMTPCPLLPTHVLWCCYGSNNCA